ncbi:sugar-binding transcriptional regulator [Clostridium hydrogeniformans]|uniref:sugar-binding transcriptional regulator n=1 Tax=Clostridium hydrogeniformans TaxID=349933 RepID=UPI0004898815|nr:sugar-binding transcriptional regulator [Clostridium hydrogeniformans]
MNDILKLQQKLVPELVELLEKRYNILKTIYYNQPIGRRILANRLDIGERIVRSEVNFLKSQNLIEINTPGMNVTLEGEEVLEKLKNFIHEIKGLTTVEKDLKDLLGLEEVIVVPGNMDEDESSIKELGRAAGNYIKSLIKENSIIALAGGTTVKEMVDNLPKLHSMPGVLVVPARGGMGRNVETQANTLAASLAKKINAQYKMLHVPDNLSEKALSTILNEDEIKEVASNIKKADILIYGIGRAEHMGYKRGLSEDKISSITNSGAVGEAYGCYFDIKGNMVFSTSSVGISLEDADKIKHIIAVAGGENKAEAILAAQIGKSKGVLITDEGAARKILENV